MSRRTTAPLRRRLAFLRPAVRAARRILRVVVRRTERLLGVLLRARRLPLPTWLLIPLAHELTDTAALERIIDRTTARRARGRDRAGTRRLHEVALLRRARLSLDRRDDADALHWFDRAHHEAGPTPNTWTWRAVTLRRLGRLEESRLAGETAAESEPVWCPAVVHLGILYQQLGDRPRSVACWRRLLASPDATDAELRWAWVGVMRARELELALEVAERLVGATGGAPGARAARAVTLVELGRADDAAREIGELEGDASPDAVRAVAFFRGRIGDAAGAHELLTGLPANRRGEDACLELIHALRDDGHLELAAAFADDAVAAYPEHPELRQARDLAAGVLAVFTDAWRQPPGDAAPHASAPDGSAGPPVAGRILHVVGRTVPYASSGYAVRTHHTVRAQRALGIDAQVVSQLGFPWEDGHEPDRVEDVDGVPHHRLPVPADARLPIPLDERLRRHVDALVERARELCPAALHAASDFRNGVVAIEAGERLGIPVIYEMRGFWEETWLARHGEHAMDRDTYRLRRERELEVAQRAAHVVTLAPTMRDELVARGVDAERISLAPNAVSPDDFPECDRDTELAADLGIADGEVVVGYVSSFVGYEGIHILLDAIATLRRSGAPVRGLLVGDGAVRPELERQARTLGIAEEVIFTGRVPHAQVGDYYRLIDVFVVPRTNARVCRLVSPLKPYEAMATRRAMVVSGTPVLRDIVEDGVTGLVFEPEDPDDLSTRMRELVDDPDRRETLGRAAREQVLTHHTWERNAERYLEVYRSLGVV